MGVEEAARARKTSLQLLAEVAEARWAAALAMFVGFLKEEEQAWVVAHAVVNAPYLAVDSSTTQALSISEQARLELKVAGRAARVEAAQGTKGARVGAMEATPSRHPVSSGEEEAGGTAARVTLSGALGSWQAT